MERGPGAQCGTAGCRSWTAKKITGDMVSKASSEIELPAEIVKNHELLKYCLRQARPRDPQVEDTPLNRIESARFSSECCPQPDQGGGITRRRNEEITGHKTEHVFERYNINRSEDIRDALIKVGQFSDATVTMIAEKPSTR